MQSESERLAAYRQLRTEIRGSNKHLIVGIDIAKEKHYAFMGTANGTTLCKQLIFQNNKEGFDLLIARAELLRLTHQCEQVVFGVEPTANYHKPLAEHLERASQIPSPVDPVEVAELPLDRSDWHVQGAEDRNFMDVLKELTQPTPDSVDVDRGLPLLRLVKVADQLRGLRAFYEGFVGLSAESRKERVLVL